jgi:hypothetical protein
MQLSEIVPSRIYSWVYESEYKLNKGGRSGLPVNPLHGQVTVRKVKLGQAATSEMVTRKSMTLDPNYTPSPDYTPRWETTVNPCVVRALSTGKLAVRILNPKTTKMELFVGGSPITPEQAAIIRPYIPARRPFDPTKVKVNFPYLENLTNVNVDVEPSNAVEDDD